MGNHRQIRCRFLSSASAQPNSQRNAVKSRDVSSASILPAEATLVGLSLPIAQFRTMAALLRASSRTVSKALGDQTRGYKVAVLGAAGGIGQPCGLLMKMVRAAMSLRFTSRRNPQGTDGQSAPIWRTRR